MVVLAPSALTGDTNWNKLKYKDKLKVILQEFFPKICNFEIKDV